MCELPVISNCASCAYAIAIPEEWMMLYSNDARLPHSSSVIKGGESLDALTSGDILCKGRAERNCHPDGEADHTNGCPAECGPVRKQHSINKKNQHEARLLGARPCEADSYQSDSDCHPLTGAAREEEQCIKESHAGEKCHMGWVDKLSPQTPGYMRVLVRATVYLMWEYR